MHAGSHKTEHLPVEAFHASLLLIFISTAFSYAQSVAEEAVERAYRRPATLPKYF